MSNEKIIAVVIPAYNRRKMLCKTIESVISNNIEESDIFIFDNCSTDDTVSYFNKKYKKINIIQSNTNLGLTNNIIRGLKITGYKYMMIVEDHDLLSDQCIRKLIQKLEEFPSVAICVPSRYYINQEDEIINKVDKELFKGLINGNEFLKYSLKRHDFYFPITLMLNASHLNEGCFDAMKSFRNYGDIMLWLQLTSRHDLYFFNEKIYFSREREKNNSFSNNFINGYDEVIRIHKKFHAINFNKFRLFKIHFFISAFKRILVYFVKCKINKIQPEKSMELNIQFQNLLEKFIKIIPI